MYKEGSFPESLWVSNKSLWNSIPEVSLMIFESLTFSMIDCEWEILKKQIANKKGTDLLFPSPSNPKKAVSKTTLPSPNQNILNSLNISSKKENFVKGDVRRRFSKEDYKNYPRTLKNDLKVLKKYGADIVFTPIQKQILSHKTKHNCPQFAIEKRLCGKSRPNYFPGVKNIVLKLFDIVQPDAAFFGEKDYQQYLVIKKMTESLKLNTRIICVKTVRDRNGLPLSSRNNYLSGQEFKIAIKINKLLKKLPPLIRTKLKINKILNHTKKVLIDHGVDKIDYLTVLNDDLSVRKKISDKSRIFIAAKIGNTRLIDNIKI